LVALVGPWPPKSPPTLVALVGYILEARTDGC